MPRAGVPSMHSLLRQRSLRWLGHIRRTYDSRIPKDILNGELAHERPTWRPHLRFKDLVKRDLVDMKTDIDSWKQPAADRAKKWRASVHDHILASETRRHDSAHSL